MTRPSQARRIFPGLLAGLGLLFLTGCNITITNLTPDLMRENPSQLYTISARVKASSSSIDRSSIQVSAIVDGQDRPMHKSRLADNVYEYDYALPAGRDRASYYLLVRYKFNASAAYEHSEAYTQLQQLRVERRYALPLEVNRGPVGARVTVLGGGFTPQDVISLDSVPARTVYESPSSLSFFVPSVDPKRNYNLSVSGGGSPVSAGSFRADATGVTVTPTALNLRSGEQRTLEFTIPTAAPQGGLLLDLTTDVPESVIMPEVVVPEGATSVTITIKGGKPGAGALFLKGFGEGEITIPVAVAAF